ncbi:hypothetical protein BST22_00240 [Mycolicibacterium chubuense]|uniref:Uncharacterized protein n=1 Tax=Mycolicibacterium chubuense TaxID=1800 RepID=A0A0J6VSF5_MYCCU|nr:hypothetical protein [Mycolicibacterium chubuense]KMO72422.1 hypothetical protein MCHUDSM44219_04932 [Mycolicibacterium chubuense]ORA56414.1 hypothetical protein BST22_00240 [Mycolicibacterium chubuense]SPX99172.1 membrane protein [Mycolicibacterium chubuense]
MPSPVQRYLDYRMTVAEWIGTAVLLGTPYLVIGVAYTLIGNEYLHRAEGLRAAAAFAGSVVYWPVLLLLGSCTP